MQSFTVASTNSFTGDECSRNQSRVSDLGELEQSTGFHHDDAVNLGQNSIFSLKLRSVAGAVPSLQFGGLNTNINVSEINSPVSATTTTTGINTGKYSFQKGMVTTALGNGDFESWEDSGMADTSSTDVDTDDKNQHGAHMSVDSMDRSKGKTGDQKALRRLAQNREAAKKSRLRKKVHVQQLENSQLKLNQLEQVLQRARQHGIFIASGCLGDQSPTGGNGALAFDMEYAHWLEEHQRRINDLKSAVNSHVGDNELCLLVDGVMAHYNEVFRLKSIGAKSDVFHMLSGMWKTPAERCFMWLGGFRSSELLKILGNQLEPLTDHQLMGICNLQQSSQQAEDALSQGMEALQQSLTETLTSGSIGSSGSGNVADYMGQMALAMSKLGMLENFLHQADLLRQQTLQQMHRILTTRQAARALLVISDYFSRLRALSSLWLARPRD